MRCFQITIIFSFVLSIILSKQCLASSPEIVVDSLFKKQGIIDFQLNPAPSSTLKNPENLIDPMVPELIKKQGEPEMKYLLEPEQDTSDEESEQDSIMGIVFFLYLIFMFDDI